MSPASLWIATDCEFCEYDWLSPCQCPFGSISIHSFRTDALFAFGYIKKSGFSGRKPGKVGVLKSGIQCELNHIYGGLFLITIKIATIRI